MSGSKLNRVTIDRVMSLLEADDNSGLCTSCGDEAYGVEPDARRYRCESCGELAVYGAEELLFMIGDENDE